MCQAAREQRADRDGARALGDQALVGEKRGDALDHERLGHEVHLVCQERRPEEIDGVEASGTWVDGRLEVDVWRAPARWTVYRPEIHGLLPVYVADRYEGIEARPFQDLTEPQLDRYLEANVAAVAEVMQRARPDVCLAGHLVMAPVVMARARARVPDPDWSAGLRAEPAPGRLRESDLALSEQGDGHDRECRAETPVADADLDPGLRVEALGAHDG